MAKVVEGPWKRRPAAEGSQMGWSQPTAEVGRTKSADGRAGGSGGGNEPPKKPWHKSKLLRGALAAAGLGGAAATYELTRPEHGSDTEHSISQTLTRDEHREVVARQEKANQEQQIVQDDFGIDLRAAEAEPNLHEQDRKMLAALATYGKKQAARRKVGSKYPDNDDVWGAVREFKDHPDRWGKFDPELAAGISRVEAEIFFDNADEILKAWDIMYASRAEGEDMFDRALNLAGALRHYITVGDQMLNNIGFDPTVRYRPQDFDARHQDNPVVVRSSQTAGFIIRITSLQSELARRVAQFEKGFNGHDLEKNERLYKERGLIAADLLASGARYLTSRDDEFRLRSAAFALGKVESERALPTAADFAAAEYSRLLEDDDAKKVAAEAYQRTIEKVQEEIDATGSDAESFAYLSVVEWAKKAGIANQDLRATMLPKALAAEHKGKLKIAWGILCDLKQLGVGDEKAFARVNEAAAQEDEAQDLTEQAAERENSKTNLMGTIEKIRSKLVIPLGVGDREDAALLDLLGTAYNQADQAELDKKERESLFGKLARDARKTGHTSFANSIENF